MKTPWFIEGEDELVEGVPALIIATKIPGGTEEVCAVSCDMIDDDLVITEKTHERAALIVRAVNSHDEMIRLLKWARNSFRDDTDIAREIDAALAAAKEK